MEEIPPFVEKIKHLQQIVLDLFDKEGSIDDCLKIFTRILKREKISENKNEFKVALNVICKITNNHRRPLDFPEKISQILRILKPDMLNYFSNWEIFNIFKSNKRVLLSLFREEILVPDQTMYDIVNTDKYRSNFYIRYFFPEFKQFLSPEYLKQYDLHGTDPDFDTKRKEGENDQEICKLIRKDSLEEFKNLVKQKNISLSSKIEPSYYETNQLLIQKKVTIIEYAAFFGSIQIFKHLLENKVKMQPSLWIYAIHGNNIEMIHLLEQGKVCPTDDTFKECIKQSIKFHNNAISKVLLRNYPQKEEDTFVSSIQFFNYLMFPEKFIEFLSGIKILDEKPNVLFYYLIQYDHINIVDSILKSQKLNLNAKIVSNL